MRLYKSLRRRREDIEAGALAHRQADHPLQDALDLYFRAAAAKLKPARCESAELPPMHFRWADAASITTVREINKGTLATVSDHLAELPKRVRKHGGRRGEMMNADKISPHRVNCLLSGITITLNELRRPRGDPAVE